MAANVPDRASDPDGPSTSWVADVTHTPAGEGRGYLAAVEDLLRRLAVGCSMPAAATGRWVADAPEMALSRRPRGSSGLVAHSDPGSQYASGHHQRWLPGERIRCSMGRRGTRWDNAPTGSFFASLEGELAHHGGYATRAAARASIFECTEAFHNRVRRHSSLGYVAPAVYERTHNQPHR